VIKNSELITWVCHFGLLRLLVLWLPQTTVERSFLPWLSEVGLKIKLYKKCTTVIISLALLFRELLNATSSTS